MQLHELNVSLIKRSQRIARGGRRGTYSGRGQKGQKSRAGRRIRPALRDLISRLPKKRGFRNKPKSDKPLMLQASVIAKLDGEVTLARLQKEGLISKRYRGEVKVLGKGDFKKSVILKGIKVSKQTKELIEKAGGKVEMSK